MTKQVFLLLMTITKLAESKQEIKFQSCEATGEPFQVAYDENCTRACFQMCGETPGLDNNCIAIPQYCEEIPHLCGDTGCECLPSYQLPGNPYSRENLHENAVTRIMCENNSIEVTINKCAMGEWGFALSDFYIGGSNEVFLPADDILLPIDANNTCRGEMGASESGLDYSFRIRGDLTACGGDKQIIKEDDIFGISNVIKARTQRLDQRYAIFIAFTCVYLFEPLRTPGVVIGASSHNIKIFSKKLHQDFNLTIELWRDGWNQTLYRDDVMLVNKQYLYVTVGAEVDDGNKFNIQIVQASVGTSNLYNDQLSIPLIQDGCVYTDNRYSAEVFINRNSDSLSAEFKFRAFQIPFNFSDEQERIYVHVVAHLCDQIFEGQCKMDCSSSNRKIKKRSFTPPERQMKNITSQPITVLRWHKKINETGHNITVMQAFNFITESWEIAMLLGCILLLIMTLMISMSVLLLKISKNTPLNKGGKR